MISPLKNYRKIMDRFLIGDLSLTWVSGGYKLHKGEFLEKFRINSREGLEEIRFRGCFKELEPYDEYEKIIENYAFDLINVNGEKLIVYHWAYCKMAFAIWPERINANEVNTCYFNPKLMENNIINADWFFGLIGLHKVLLQKNAPIMHASYIDYKGEGILFSAPSQTGKSTQAHLWNEYCGAEIINEDRVLLREKNGVWNAYGFPCCGSSNICVNRTLPIRVIVILRQGNINKIESLSFSDKIRSLLTAVEVYQWDSEEIQSALEIVNWIVSMVDVVQLTCKPDIDAVKVLKEYLEK